MDADFIRERITRLRIRKGVSEYKMSYDLGHSRGYVNNISSGKTLPSMTEFLAICEYFDITPAEFFDERQKDPTTVKTIKDMLGQLDEEDVELVRLTVERLAKNTDRS